MKVKYNPITNRFEKADDEIQEIEQTIKTEKANNKQNATVKYNAVTNRFENIEPTVTLDNNEQNTEEGNTVQLSTKEIYNLAQENAKTKRNELKEAKKDYQNKLSDEYQKRDVSFESPISKEKDSVLTYETQNKEQLKQKIADGEKVQEARKNAENERLKAMRAYYDSNLADSQEGNARSEAEDVTWWDKTGGNVIRGLGDLASVFDVTGTEYVDENGKKYYLPTYNEYRQQKVSESYDTKVGKLLGDAAYNISKILGSTAVNTVAPGAGTAIYWTDMFTDNYKSAINGGYEKENALLYSAIGTGAEYMTGKFLGSATKGLTGGKTSSLSSAIGNTTNKLIKNPKISSIIGSAGSEATEEFLQEYIENINRLAVLENSTNPDDYIDILTDPDVLEDALYSAGVGAVSGGVTNITDPTGNNIENNINVLTEFKAQLQESKNNTTDSKKIETFDKAIKLVDDYLANPFINEGNISNELNNALQNTTQDLNTNVQSNSERQNSSNISQELKQEIQNKTREQNRNNSDVEFVPTQDVLPYKSSGGYRTEDQINVLENDIRQNGITNPIELIRENDGTIRVENGNHRLEVAQRLGLEEVPIVFTNSIENITDIPYNNVDILVEGKYNGNHENTRTISGNDVSEQLIDGNSKNNSEQFNDRRTTTGNDRLYQQMVGYNNRSSSNTTRQQNSVQSQAKRLNDSISNQVNTFNLGRDNNVNSNTTNNSFIDSAKKYNIKTDNDTIRTIDRVMSERKINAIFDDTQFKNNNVNALWRINEDGSRAVVFNPNANTQDLMENVAVHELYHDIANQQGNNYLQDLVLNMASTKEGYLKVRKALSNEYAKVYDASDPNFNNIVNEEAVASILGEKLGNQEFINQLTTEKRSVARVIYDAIVNLLNKLNKLTGYKSEKLYWADVKNKFEKAYKNTGVNRTTGKVDTKTRYSQKTLQDGTSYVETETGLFTKEDGTPMSQREIYNTLIGKQIKFNDGIVATIKQWLPNNKNMYNELFKRYPRYENVKDIKNVNNSINENIVELLENSDNISQNEPDYMNRHKDNKINSFDTRRVSFFDGQKAYDLDFSIAKMQDGSYVAYAKKNLIPNNNLLKSIKKEAPTSKSRGVLPSTSNISDFNQNVKSDTRYSMQQLGKNTQKDNQGHLLSKQQQEYFKNSKAKDKNGNLKVLYHGTPNNFTRFNYDFIGNNGTAIGKGFYLTDSKDVASGYTGETGNVMEVYTNITNPMSLDKKNITKADLKKFIQQLSSKDEYYLWDYGDLSSESYNSVLDKAVDSNYEYSDNDVDLIHGVLNTSTLSWEESFRLLKNILGYDGVIKDYGEHIVYVPTLPEQIKLITNETPTKNDDIRYSKENVTWDDFVKENFKNEGTGRRLQDLKENVTMQKSKNNASKTELNENKQDDVLTIKQDNNNITNETSNNKGDGESRFYRNITERSKFLTQENRDKLSTEDYIKYYDTVSNEESMKRALKRLDEGGQAELTRWFAKGTKGLDKYSIKDIYDSTDVAEGWILLKRAQDNQDYDMMVEVAKKMREIGTTSGQTIQMYNLLSRLTPEGMVKYATSELDEAWQIASKNKSQKWRDKYGDDFQLTPEETQFIVDQMNKVEKMPDSRAKTVEIAKVQKMLQDKLPPLKGDGIKAWMRISMLLNPKTQVRNVSGNALIVPVNAIADRFSAMADKIISKKTGVRTTGKTNWKNYRKGFKKGLFESYEDFKLGINTRNIQGNRFEIGRGKSFNEHHKGFLSKPRNVLSKGLNRVDSFLSFVLDAGDRGFYEASFTQSINNQLVLNNTTEVTQDMIDIATNEALSRTWQDNNNYTKFVLDIRRGMNKIHIKGYGLGDVLIPFAKTPANLTKAIVDYSPVGLVKTLTVDAVKLKNNISNGTITAQQQHQFVQNLGKATAGTLLYVAGMALAQAGITTGANDDDKDVSDFMRNTLGIQPYSIKIGNHSFTYDWAQPVAAPFAITADITRALNDDDVTLQDAITTSLDSGFNILLEQSFLSGIQSVLNSSYGSTTENIIDEVLGLPARAVSNFVKQINDMIDPKTRMVYEKDQPFESAKNQIKTKIPGLSQDLPVKRDTLGREIEKYGGENNFFNVFLNPANTSKGKVSESAKEIYDVYQATKDKTIMPRSAPNELSITIEDRKGNKKKKELVLDNQDKSDFLEISGGIVEENVKELKDNRYYKKLDDDDKAKVIKEIVDYAYNKAKADLLDVEMSEISGYKTVEKKIKGGTALYDYYARQVYQDR